MVILKPFADIDFPHRTLPTPASMTLRPLAEIFWHNTAASSQLQVLVPPMVPRLNSHPSSLTREKGSSRSKARSLWAQLMRRVPPRLPNFLLR